MMDLQLNQKTKQQQFEECIEEHGNALFHYIYSLVKHKQLAEDLYQDVLMAAFIALPSFQEQTKMKNWLFKIGINKCRDHWRKQKAQQRYWEEKAYMNDDYSLVNTILEDEIIQKDTNKEVKETLEDLPEIYKEPLLLFYYHNQTLVEISRSSNIPLSTVKTRIRRGKERLKPLVAGMQ
ncbi:RNA polymerase sigma factor [Cytobacillus gottheilii]|uniref:RNA polymerase sigma factor n=1 Tax=Cytobacillus gottheilii TaxID=859144 RepID=UPI00082F940F|nr:RNA polymerase sigma factor [Cytobacillus gottheilii]